MRLKRKHAPSVLENSVEVVVAEEDSKLIVFEALHQSVDSKDCRKKGGRVRHR